MKIAIINESTLVSKLDFEMMVTACDIQLKRDACPAWGYEESLVVSAKSLKSVPKGFYIISIIDDADQADALGYHSETPSGRPYGRVFVKPVMDEGGTYITGSSSVSCTLSHEVLEMWCDPWVNTWYENDDGKLWSGEICDPVESDSYSIVVNGHRVAVSNFVLPSYFNAGQKKTKYDFLKVLNKPFSINKGGYAMIRGPKGGVKEVLGRSYPKWKVSRRRHPTSRYSKRC